ncbi:hypothetical protein MAP00_003756 [Monascus purpureus]|nr:hypothetical protein MAP00_003756 [Monascus purpureus]
MAASSVSSTSRRITPDNHGALVTLLTFIWLILMCLVVVVQSVIFLFYKQRRNAAYALIWIATVVAIAQSVLVQLSVEHGLGQHIVALSPADVERYSKQFHYASNILFIAVLAISKLSVALLILQLAPDRRIHIACFITLSLTLAWTLISIFGLAFHCKLPQPWIYLPHRCAGAVEYPIAVLNILTDLALSIIPCLLLWNVQALRATRFWVMLAFDTRLLVVGLTIAEMVFLPTYLQSSDPTWTILIPTIFRELRVALLSSLSLSQNLLTATE